MDKAAIRKEVKARVKALSDPEKQLQAETTFSAIEKMPCFEHASSILLYYSLPDELPSHRFVEVWAQSKRIFLPRVKGDILEIAPYGTLQVSDRFGIEEPVSDAVSPACIDLVIVPAVALDVHGSRLGRGKGYYDKLLPLCPRAYKIGVALDCQLVEQLPVEAHDFPLDAIVTASRQIVVNPFQF